MVTKMYQISIFDLLEEKPIQEPCGRRCDCKCFSLTCFLKRGYIRHDGKWVRHEDGTVMIAENKECDWIPIDEDNPWVRLTDEQLVYVYKSSIKEYTRTEHDPKVIDHIGKGTVDEKPAIIGLALCVSGLYEEFEELKPFYWKENKYGVINDR